MIAKIVPQQSLDDVRIEMQSTGTFSGIANDDLRPCCVSTIGVFSPLHRLRRPRLVLIDPKKRTGFRPVFEIDPLWL